MVNTPAVASLTSFTRDPAVLAYIPSPAQGVWQLGPVPVRAYAVFIIIGIIVAVFWGDKRWQARGGEPGELLDVAIWAVPFGLIGGRLYHVATDWKTYFGEGGRGISGALSIWQGGLGIWGAVLFGALGAWIGARIYGIRLPAFGDAIAPPILLAQAIGRFGNYFNQELFGEPTTVPWGLEIFYREDAAGNVGYAVVDGVSTGEVYQVVHPTFLYEALWNVLIVVALVLIDRTRKIGHGRLFALYCAGYSLGRLGIELMRTDPATHIFGVRINVFTSIIVIVGGLLYFFLATKGRETGLSMYWPKRAEELESAGIVGYVPPALDEDEKVGDDTGSGDTGSGESAETLSGGAAAAGEQAEALPAAAAVDEPTEVDEAAAVVEAAEGVEAADTVERSATEPAGAQAGAATAVIPVWDDVADQDDPADDAAADDAEPEGESDTAAAPAGEELTVVDPDDDELVALEDIESGGLVDAFYQAADSVGEDENEDAEAEPGTETIADGRGPAEAPADEVAADEVAAGDVAADEDRSAGGEESAETAESVGSADEAAGEAGADTGTPVAQSQVAQSPVPQTPVPQTPDTPETVADETSVVATAGIPPKQKKGPGFTVVSASGSLGGITVREANPDVARAGGIEIRRASGTDSGMVVIDTTGGDTAPESGGNIAPESGGDTGERP